MPVRRPHRWKCLLASVFVAGAAVPVGASATAAQFDRLFAHLDHDSTVLEGEAARRETSRLRTLIPRGDVARELRYKSLSCLVDFQDMQAGHAFALAAVDQAQRAGERLSEIRLRLCEAGYRESVQTPQRALEGYEQALVMAREAEDTRLIAEGLVARGGVRSLMGDQGLALMDFLEAQKRLEAGGYRHSAEANLQNIAIAYRRMGEGEKALEYLATSRANSQRNRDWAALVLDLLQTAFAYEELQRPDDAMRTYREAESVARQHGRRYEVAAAHLGIAGTLVAQGRHAQALSMVDEATRGFAAVGDTSNVGMLALYSGQARAGLGEHARAVAHFDTAVREFETGGHERYLALAYPARAASLEATSRLAEAAADLRRHVAVTDALQRKRGDQRTLLLRYGFDDARRAGETRRLVEEKQAHEQQVAALDVARRWQWTALALGAVLLLLLGRLVHRQLRTTRRLRALALTDELTGVANRRSIELFGEDALDAARRSGTGLTALTVDIDRFKSINDRYGHFAGDEALIRVARACQDTLREFDRLGRIGGEEFLVLLPDTTLAAALPIAERLRQRTETLALDDLAPGLRVTLSIGAAALREDETELGALTRRADLALYRAKRLGRNRVEAEA